MLDPATIRFDSFNTWREIWYYPTHRELYVLGSDGDVAAKLCLVKRDGEWPMWIFKTIASAINPKRQQGYDMIVKAWETRILDRINSATNSHPRRSAHLNRRQK